MSDKNFYVRKMVKNMDVGEKLFRRKNGKHKKLGVWENFPKSEKLYLIKKVMSEKNF